MLIENQKARIINNSFYLLIPKDKILEENFNVFDPFSFRLIRPIRSRKYYLENIIEKNGSYYFVVTSVYKKESVNFDSIVSYEIENLDKF